MNAVGVSMEVFPVSVDYDQFIEDMIAAGGYDSVNDDINDHNFGANRDGMETIDVTLVDLPERRTRFGYELKDILEEQGYRPLDIAELLTLGAAFPNEQRKFEIVALDALWERTSTNPVVATLRMDEHGRRLGHLSLEGLRGDNIRFACVRMHK